MDGFHAKELLAIFVAELVLAGQGSQYFLFPYVKRIGTGVGIKLGVALNLTF